MPGLLKVYSCVENCTRLNNPVLRSLVFVQHSCIPANSMNSDCTLDNKHRRETVCNIRSVHPKSRLCIVGCTWLSTAAAEGVCTHLCARVRLRTGGRKAAVWTHGAACVETRGCRRSCMAALFTAWCACTWLHTERGVRICAPTDDSCCLAKEAWCDLYYLTMQGIKLLMQLHAAYTMATIHSAVVQGKTVAGVLHATQVDGSWH